MSDSIEKRFCFDVVSDNLVTYTLQALGEEDRKLWLEAMEAISSANKVNNQNHILANSNDLGNGLREEYVLDAYGLEFIKQLIKHIEKHGLEDQGIYRVSGVSSKITKLMRVYQENYKNFIAINSDTYSSDGQPSYLDENKIQSNVENIVREFSTHELKTVTSALKNYLRNLPEPLMSFRLHSAFINAAKIEQKDKRVNAVHELVHNLPKINFQMLSILIEHLHKIASKSDKNLMSICNLGVCFGPTLLRSEEESVAAIMNLKFCNVVIEILIENHDKIFNTKPFDLNNKQTILSCFNNTIPMNNNLRQATIGLPQQQPQLTPTFLQPHQSNFNSNNLVSPNNRLPNSNFNHSNSNLHQTGQQFNFRQASQQQPQQLIHQQQQSNSFNYLNNFNFNCIINQPAPATHQQFNSFNRPLAGMYNNWNSSANNLNLIDTTNYQLSNNTNSNSFMPYSAIRALPATVQQNSQQSPTLPRPVQQHPTSSNFYVPYNPNSNCNLSNNSANTTNSSNSNNLLLASKANSLSNNNLLNSIKNLTIDVNQPINTSSSSSSSSSALSNLSQSLSKSNNTASNSGDGVSLNKNPFNFNPITKANSSNHPNSIKTTQQPPPNQPQSQGKGRTVKTLYACLAGSSTELSFSPNTIIHDGNF